MKTSNITKSALALALGLCASGAWALTTTNAFESFTCAADTPVTNLTSTGLSWTAGADAADYTYAKASTGKLVVDTGDSSVTGTLSNASVFNENLAGHASFEAKVTFTPATETPSVGGSDLKFALYAKAGTGTTNLYVYANGGETNTAIAVAANTEKTVKVDFLSDSTFQVSVDGSAAAGPYNFANSGTISKIEFQGNGEVDDLAFTYDAPFTLTWVAGITPVSYTVNGGTAESLTGVTSGTPIYGVAAGDTVAFTYQNADGATKTVTATASSSGMTLAADTTFTWADYLGDAVDGAYEIDNLAELKLFQAGVATNTTSENASKLATTGLTFKLTDNITLTEAWPGIGVQNGKDIYSTETFNGAAFCGTFDGQNHTISGFQMVGGGLDYCGFFNSTYGATIQNLNIQYKGSLFATDTSKNSSLESGATFVGVAKNSTLRNLTTLAGTVSCDKGFGGIVGYLTSGSLVDSCTNNVNMTSLKPNKCGGIAMIAQNGTIVTIQNCQNNGSVAGSNEIGGLVGYIGNCGAIISNCESTVAYKLFHQEDAIPTMKGVNKGNATVVSYTEKQATGPNSTLNFATVNGSVATFVADNALAAGNTYKVMHAATATYEFAEAGTIAFDTALFTPTYAVTAAEGYTVVGPTGAGDVKTFTALTVVSVNVSGGANASAAWTVNGFAVDSAPTTLTEGQTYSVTYTANEGYKFADGATTSASGTAGTEAISITIADAIANSPSYTATQELTIGGESGTTHELSATEAAYLNSIADGKTPAEMNTILANVDEETFEDAALLNQDIANPTTAGSYEFKVSSLKKKAGGKVEVKVTLTRSGSVLGKIKGTVVLKTCATPNGNYAEVASENIEANFGEGSAAATQEFTATFTGVTDKFFKAEIK